MNILDVDFVMVIDGNQKIRRSVCMATDSGSIEYPCLPGSIKIGCTKSPKFKSRFCEQHKPRSYSGNPQYLSENHIQETNPTIHKVKVKLWNYFWRRNLHVVEHTIKLVHMYVYYTIICVVTYVCARTANVAGRYFHGRKLW